MPSVTYSLTEMKTCPQQSAELWHFFYARKFAPTAASLGFLTALPCLFSGAITLPSILMALTSPLSFLIKLAVTRTPLTPLCVIAIN